jgi:hypothetical protein
MTTVTQHNNRWFAHIEGQGKLLALKGSFSSLAKNGGGKRGLVTEFSPQSRLRLLRKMARIAPSRAVFVTLTYPERYPSTARAKMHLRALLERIRRRYPQSSAFWRLEYQERGAPHFHLLFFELPFIPFATLRQWWAEIVSAYVDGYLPRVRIEKIRSHRGAMYYTAKYVAKMSEEGSVSAFFILDAYLHAGRWWGIFNKYSLPYADSIYMEIEQFTPASFWRAKGYLEQFNPTLYPNKHRGKVIFVDGAINHIKILYSILRTDGRQTFIRPLDTDKRQTYGYQDVQALALSPETHLRTYRIHSFQPARLRYTCRSANDG